jgi:hypothetical protein
MNALAITQQDISLEGGELRIQDIRLAQALGFDRPDRIKALIARHRRSLERFGSVFTTVVKTSKKGGRPGKADWLNKKQSLFICTKSEAEFATDVTIEMVTVFDDYLSGKLQPASPSLALPETGNDDALRALCEAYEDIRTRTSEERKKFPECPVMSGMEQGTKEYEDAFGKYLVGLDVVGPLFDVAENILKRISKIKPRTIDGLVMKARIYNTSHFEGRYSKALCEDVIAMLGQAQSKALAAV